jgi:hypothetical protein
MLQMPGGPRVLFPSEEVEVIFRFAVEGIHDQRSERDKNRGNDKNFHEFAAIGA